MRILLVALLVACAAPADKTCPGSVAEGDACSFSGRCWHDDTFSGCASGWCSCVAGKVACQPIAPETGKACSDSQISECSYEGNPSCVTNPTAEYCTCDEMGTWSCTCFCYGGLTSCPIDPCTVPPQKLAGALCAGVGAACSYPGNVTCRCESDTPDANATFHCSS